MKLSTKRYVGLLETLRARTEGKGANRLQMSIVGWGL